MVAYTVVSAELSSVHIYADWKEFIGLFSLKWPVSHLFTSRSVCLEM